MKYFFSGISLLIFLIATNGYLLFLTAYYLTPKIYSDPQQQQQHQKIMRYILKEESAPASQLLDTEQFNHITDVKNLVQKLPLIATISALVLYLLNRRNPINFSKLIKYMAVPLFLAVILVAVSYQSFFIQFHQLLFPQGNWSFPENSILIQLYPEQFWKTAAIILAALLIIQLALIKQLPTNTRK